MWSLVFVLAAGLNTAACEQALGNDAEAQQICRIPNISLAEAKELHGVQRACTALRAAIEASGRTYRWVEITGNDGYKTSCTTGKP
jgi:hypothetical protein